MASIQFVRCIRHPKLDDQAVFWKIIRTSQNPTVLPLGTCRHFNTDVDKKRMRIFNDISNKKYLVSCMLDTCMFSSGMLSRIYVPEFTYRKYIVVITVIVIHSYNV